MHTPKTRILKSIDRFACLSIVQAGKLAGYTIGSEKGSYTRVSTITNELFSEGLIDYANLPTETAFGRPTRLYVTTPEGRKELRLSDIPIHTDRPPFDAKYLVGRAKREGKEPRKLPEYWRHVHDSNWFLINAHLWKATTSEASFRRMLTEIDTHKEKGDYPITVTLGDGTQIGIIPDGLLEVIYDGKGGFRFLVELEHDNYSEMDFRQKVRAYTILASGPNIKLYGSATLTVLFLATRGEEHRKRLLTWIAKELRELDKEEFAPLFRVTGGDPSGMSLFIEPVWSIPAVSHGFGDYEPHFLFEG